jgi:hypothetical protein
MMTSPRTSAHYGRFVASAGGGRVHFGLPGICSARSASWDGSPGGNEQPREQPGKHADARRRPPGHQESQHGDRRGEAGPHRDHTKPSRRPVPSRASAPISAARTTRATNSVRTNGPARITSSARATSATRTTRTTQIGQRLAAAIARPQRRVGRRRRAEPRRVAAIVAVRMRRRRDPPPGGPHIVVGQIRPRRQPKLGERIMVHRSPSSNLTHVAPRTPRRVLRSRQAAPPRAAPFPMMLLVLRCPAATRVAWSRRSTAA